MEKPEQIERSQQRIIELLYKLREEVFAIEASLEKLTDHRVDIGLELKKQGVDISKLY